MRILLLFLFVWLIRDLPAQPRSGLDLIVGAEYTGRMLKPGGSDTAKNNFRLGFTYHRQITRRIWLKTGLRFARIGYRGEKRTGLKWGPEFDENGNWVPDPTLPHEIQHVVDHWFVEIPLALRLEMRQRKITPFVELGMSPHIYIITRKTMLTDLGENREHDRNKPDGFNTVSFVGSCSAGLLYRIGGKTALILQPIVRYHVTNTAQQPVGPDAEHFYSAGVEFGLVQYF